MSDSSSVLAVRGYAWPQIKLGPERCLPVGMLHKLAPKQISAANEPSRVRDSGGLYLSISRDGRKRWVFFYALKGKQREMGLGSAGKDGVTLAKAREAAGAARQWLQAGTDPIEIKREAERAVALQAVPTFGSFAHDCTKTMRPAWHKERHAAQWEATLRIQAAPIQLWCQATASTQRTLQRPFPDSHKPTGVDWHLLAIRQRTTPDHRQ